MKKAAPAAKAKTAPAKKATKAVTKARAPKAATRRARKNAQWQSDVSTVAGAAVVAAVIVALPSKNAADGGVDGKGPTDSTQPSSKPAQAAKKKIEYKKPATGASAEGKPRLSKRRRLGRALRRLLPGGERKD